MDTEVEEGDSGLTRSERDAAWSRNQFGVHMYGLTSHEQAVLSKYRRETVMFVAAFCSKSLSCNTGDRA